MLRDNVRIEYLAICLSILILFGGSSAAEPNNIEWQNCLGGSNNDFAGSIQQTNDGGYVLAGNTVSNDGNVRGNLGSSDFWVVKLSSSRAIQWQKCLGGSYEDKANCIRQTADGGYIVVGDTRSNDGDVSGNHGLSDVWAVKLNSSGAIEWQKSLGGSSEDGANSVRQTSDDGYVIAGYTQSSNGDVSENHGKYDYWVVKLNPTGAIEWQKCLGGSGPDWAESIQQTSDDGYIVAGYTESNDSDVIGNHGGIYDDFWVVKLDSTGSMEWQKCLGGSSDDFAYDMKQTSDGGYIVAGASVSTNGDVTGNHGGYYDDFWVVKLDSTGAMEWQKSLGGANTDNAHSIQQTTDGGYIVAGSTNSNDSNVMGNHGNYDFLAVKLNSSGVIQWQRCLGGSKEDAATSIFESSDRGYILSGYSLSNDFNVKGNQGGYDYWMAKISIGAIGVLRQGTTNGRFILDENRSRILDSDDPAFDFGLKTDKPVIGDWNGDAKWEVGVFRPTEHKFYLDTNGDRALSTSDTSFSYGLSKDLPVTGDWNGDAKWEVGVFRPTEHKFYLDTNGDRALSTSDASFSYGLSKDLPVTGDWNGDAKWEVGVFRPTEHKFYLDTNGDRALSTSDASFSYGLSTDLPIIGDWNGDGKDEAGVFRPSTHTFYLDYDGSRALNSDEVSFSFGATGDRPIAGRW
jgi:hypothetical protein